MEQLILSQVSFEQLKSGIANEVIAQLKNSLQTPPEKNEELLTRKETALYLGISFPTLRHYTQTGRLTSYRLGTRVRYKRSEVETVFTKVNAAKYKGV